MSAFSANWSKICVCSWILYTVCARQMTEQKCVTKKDVQIISYNLPYSIRDDLVQTEARKNRRSILSARVYATKFHTLHQKLFYAHLIETLKCRNIIEGLAYTSLRLTLQHIQLQKNRALINLGSMESESPYRLDQTLSPVKTSKYVPPHTLTAGKWNITTSIFRIVCIWFTILLSKWQLAWGLRKIYKWFCLHISNRLIFNESELNHCFSECWLLKNQKTAGTLWNMCNQLACLTLQVALIWYIWLAAPVSLRL